MHGLSQPWDTRYGKPGRAPLRLLMRTRMHIVSIISDLLLVPTEFRDQWWHMEYKSLCESDVILSGLYWKVLIEEGSWQRDGRSRAITGS